MIAVDTSSWVAFFSDREPSGDDTALVESALADHQACLPPVVLTELFSDPKLSRTVVTLLSQLPVLELKPASWERAGLLRAKLIARRRRARLADALIAQACLDHGLRLVTRDPDFRHFARLGGLRYRGPAARSLNPQEMARFRGAVQVRSRRNAHPDALIRSRSISGEQTESARVYVDQLRGQTNRADRCTDGLRGRICGQVFANRNGEFGFDYSARIFGQAEASFLLRIGSWKAGSP